jgi:hypothetical protein
MHSGAFHDVGDVIMHALHSAPLAHECRSGHTLQPYTLRRP